MANITPFQAPNDLGLRPSELGPESMAAAARRGGAFFNQAAQDYKQVGQEAGSALRDAGDVYLKHVEHEEINKGAADLANRQLTLTQQWDQLAKNSDPNDPTVAQKFRETVLEPELQKFAENFSTERGQQFAEQHAEALRTHLDQKMRADQSALAGEALKVNIAKTVNGLAASARLDPSSLDYSLKTVESSITGVVGSSPTLTPETAARVHGEVLQRAREAIVKSAVVGMIEKNPNIDLAAIEKKYGDYITGPEMQMFQKAAKAQAKADFLTNRQIEVYQRQQDEQKVHAAANQNFTDNVAIDPQTNRVIIKPDYFKGALDIARNNPNAPNAATTAKTIIDWGEHQQNLKDEVIRDEPATRTDLTDRMFSADKPTSDIEIMRAEVDRKISRQTAQSMLQLHKALTEEPLKGPIWHDTIDAVKGELVLSGVGLPGKDIAGEANYAKWAQTFIPQYLSAKRAGTLEPNALDVKDPNSMISKSMAPFKRTVSDQMNDYMSTLGNLSDQPITGVKVENAPPFNPPKTWQYSASRDQYRDPASGKVYDRAGREVK